MAMLLKGAPVAAALNDRTKSRVEALRGRGIVPTLALVRAGENDADIYYERGAMKRCAALGVEARSIVLRSDVSEAELIDRIQELNRDNTVHGVLLFRPLPRHISDERVRAVLPPEKDVDGITDGSLAGVFTGSGRGFCPCTAESCTEILDFYNIDCTGKRAVVLGRSLVVGKPVSQLLLAKNATVTVCHTRTQDMPSITKQADIVVVAAGKMETIGAEYFKLGAVVIDVGIGWNEEKQKLCGDVRFDEAEPLVSAITPVPGGVGAVTTSVLVSHVVETAKK